MKKTWTAPVATCVGAATLFTSGFSIALADNDVELTVDGQTTHAHQLGGTVADLLNAHGIALDAGAAVDRDTGVIGHAERVEDVVETGGGGPQRPAGRSRGRCP